LPPLRCSDWGQEYIYIPEGNPEAGKLRLSRTPYSEEPLNCASDRHVRAVVLMWASQTGKTLALTITQGFFTHYKPSTVIFVNPTINMARNYSRTKWRPTVESSPVLNRLIPRSRAKGSGNTILMQNYAGGYAVFIGANAASEAASRTTRVVFADEINRYAVSANQEGSVLGLTWVRQKNFSDAFSVFASTPTIKGFCAITDYYESTDQRKWFVPCPHCGTSHWLKWSQFKINKESPELSYYECESCHGHITNDQKYQMVDRGHWEPTAIPKKGFENFRGYWLWGINSPWTSFQYIAEEYLKAEKDPEKLKVFTNTLLCEAYENKLGETLSPDLLLTRIGNYQMLEVPAGALILTAGVDVQGDRLVLTIYGWGEREQAWLIFYGEIEGKPSEPHCWKDLTHYLNAVYRHETGIDLKIMRCAIDSGYSPNEIYIYVRDFKSAWYYGRTHPVIAVKGGDRPMIVTKPSKVDFSHNNKKATVDLRMVGRGAGNSTIYGRLGLSENAEDAIGWFHFPSNTPPLYFDELVGEHKTMKLIRNEMKEVWEKKPSNEANVLACTRYALAALYSLGANLPTWDWTRALAMGAIARNDEDATD
jgi:phage terminase large subunit GpA-like protein